MKLYHKLCALALSLLGLSAYAQEWERPKRTKIVEGFELEDSFLTVYGGRRNYITTKLYGSVYDKDKKLPLKGIKIALYSGTHEMASAYSQENGDYYFDDFTVWAGLRVEYTMIVSDPNGEFAPLRRELCFELDEVTREEIVVLERK
ncbi:MAG: hypothetical protein IJ158_04450 [Treponema sp.]|nr:hypothetical protein [Treponema sp.]